MQMHACVSLEGYRFPLLPFFVHRLHDRRCAVQNLEKEDMLSRFDKQEVFPIASVLLVGKPCTLSVCDSVRVHTVVPLDVDRWQRNCHGKSRGRHARLPTTITKTNSDHGKSDSFGLSG